MTGRTGAALGLLTVAALMACGQPQLPLRPIGSTAGPTARTGASAAFDPASGEVVMFGGTNRSGAMNETWTWDGSHWRKHQPTTSPAPREDAVLAFDPESHRLILFGGTTCTPVKPNEPIGCGDTQILTDTWAWDGIVWSLLSTSDSPQVDYFSFDRINAATDDSHGRIILVAHGHGDREDRVQTWSFDRGGWRRLNPAHVPHVWDFSGPQFDRASHQLILLQGRLPHFDCGTGPCANDFQRGMWTWDGSDWRMVTTNTPPDSGQLFQTSDGLMLFASWGQYLWKGSSWDGGESLPWGDALREGYAGAYDAPRHTVVVYGGDLFESNQLYGDLLGWDGRHWKTLAPAPA